MKTILILYSLILFSFFSIGTQVNTEGSFLQKVHKLQGLPLVNTDRLESKVSRVTSKALDFIGFESQNYSFKARYIRTVENSPKYRLHLKNSFLYLHSGLSPPSIIS